MEIITKKISNNHNDSVWYEGEIAKVKKDNGTELLLIACGDIRIHNKKGELVYDGKERNSGIKGGFNNDGDLKKIGNNYDDKYYWENNNWFEVLFKKETMGSYDTVMGDVAYGYDESLEMLKGYVDDKKF